jgi:hypothetical protein
MPAPCSSSRTRRPIRTGTTNTKQFLRRDHQGGVVKVTNAAGSVDQALAFDAWGLRRNASDCVFRLMPVASSGACRSPIPVHAGHPFRSMPVGV